MRIYLAAASLELTRARAWRDKLREEHFIITQDWIQVVDRQGSENTNLLLAPQAHKCATDDLEGVQEAEYLWLLYPETRSAGCFVELGYALALRRPVVISGRRWRESIFSQLATAHFETDEEAFSVFVDMQRATR